MEILEDSNIVMVRSPWALVELNQIGYGWEKVDFSQYESVEAVISAIKEAYGGIGRRRKMVERFFNLKKGDIVITPFSGSIAIAIVEGQKTFDPSIPYGVNRIHVKYLTLDEKVSYIPRKVLETSLETRLKIRASNANLNEFRDEVVKHVQALESGNIHTWEKSIAQQADQAEENFKKELLSRLRSGKNIGISAGGIGLEKLVLELTELKGYTSKIPAKNEVSGIADADIVATKSNDLTGDIEALIIQVKHHNNKSSDWGIKQLIAYPEKDEYAFSRKLYITTASLSDESRELAEKNDIITIEGEDLVDWIYENVSLLSNKMISDLGIILKPVLY